MSSTAIRQDAITAMVERFQCPGCVCGGDTDCGSYAYSEHAQQCTSHVLGTSLGVGNNIALGLPKGFCRPGIDWAAKPPRSLSKMNIRLWTSISGDLPPWDELNVPVWAMEQDGCLFVRTFSPRVNESCVDVIEGGTLAMVPRAVDVGQFIGEID